MIKSMTGFGKRSSTINGKEVNAEIRSLNSKYSDISIKIPALFKQKEMEIRKMLSNRLQRGKMELLLEVDSGEDQHYRVNKIRFEKYYNELSILADEKQLSKDYLVDTILKMPDILSSDKGQLDNQTWEELQKLILSTIDDIDRFRLNEGESLASDLTNSTDIILERLNEVEQIEGSRKTTIKERLKEKLKELKEVTIDEGRFEQEILYYIEKLDINEEIVRLRSHLEYFTTTLKNDEAVKGKKLAFIGQEMGREINTIGSKSNDAELQKKVVEMKEQLEQIKEQVNNIL